MVKPEKKLAKKKTEKVQSKPATALVLRCCAPDMSSTNGFVWPDAGQPVVAPDWKRTKECGNGLHGWLYGQGDHGCSSFYNQTGAKWLVVEVAEDEIVMLGGKCKFPRGVVRFVGEKHEAAAYLIEHEPRARTVAVIGANIVCGDEQTVMVGALGTATAGYSGTATAGALGTATAGDRGTATAGDRGTATAGDRGTATAGDRGEIRVRWWDDKNQRYRTVIGYVGEDGIEANVAYRLDDKQKLVKAVA
jgi:hypothetical protein